jgi:hypothetical protein
MSDIKDIMGGGDILKFSTMEKLELLIEQKFLEWLESGSENITNVAQPLAEFIESNYIPKSDYDKLQGLKEVWGDDADGAYEALYNQHESVIKRMHELKEENGRLQEKLEVEETRVLSATLNFHELKSSVKELLKRQRENIKSEVSKNVDDRYSSNNQIIDHEIGKVVSEVYKCILNAPEPSVEDLNESPKPNNDLPFNYGNINSRLED